MSTSSAFCCLDPGAKQNLIPIAVETLYACDAVGFDLYLRRQAAERVLLYRGHDDPLQQEDLVQLADRGVTILYIRIDHALQYQRHLRERVIPDERISPVLPD